MQSQNISNDSAWQRSLVLAQGKNYLFEAHSGKGKSSLINSIYGLRSDYLGEIKYDEQDIKSFSKNEWSEIRREKIAIVFQDLRLFSELTALENIQLKNGITNFYSENEIFEMLKTVGIEDCSHRKLNTLSIGQQQRVAIVRALCQPFKFLLLDEPFSHLDNESSKIALELILKKCNEQDGGIIFAALSKQIGIEFEKSYFL